MKSQSLLRRPLFVNVLRFTTLFAIIYLLVNVFVIGGDKFIQVLSQLSSPIIAIIASALALHLWVSAATGEVSRKVWGYLAIGVILWTVAASLWAFFSLILSEELPYPSLADFFWLAGYVFIAVALIIRYRSFQSLPNKGQIQTTIAVIGVFVIAIFFFVLLPTIKDYDPAFYVESILNILYPVADIMLFAISMYIMFTLGKGYYVISWRFITLGFVLVAISDLLFFYASLHGLYYPDGRANLISILSDYADFLSYLCLALGLFANEITDTVKVESNISPNTQTNRKIDKYVVIFTNSDNEVISFGGDLLKLTKSFDKDQVVGMPLRNVLGLDSETTQNFIKQIVGKGFVNNMLVKYVDMVGNSQEAWLSALATHTSGGQYTGANIVLRTQHMPGPDQGLEGLGKESQAMVQFVLSKTGAEEKLNIQLLKGYFDAQIKGLYILVSDLGGQSIAKKLVQILNEAATKYDGIIVVTGYEVSIPEDIKWLEMENVASGLLNAACEFSISIAGLNSVNAQMLVIDQQMNDASLKVAATAGLRKR